MARRFMLRSILDFPRRLLQILVYLFALQWLTDGIGSIRRQCRAAQRGKQLRHVRRGQPLRCAPRCAVIPPEIYKRADPLIYSQYYLMEQGLAVTWDNPDIQLFENGLPIPSEQLKPDTDYDVVATIYNNSTDAPAVGLPVAFSFLSFGIGTVSHSIGTTKVDLPVKGAPGHPTLAKMTWHTPAVAGHYCLQVRLIWPDDANPKNNLGQENTNVGVAASPATFRFPVRNDDTIRKQIRLTADAYTIPQPIDCRQRPTKRDSDRRFPQLVRGGAFVPPTEQAADWTLARARHGRAAFPIPAGWKVDIEPAALELGPGDQREVTVVITPPDDFRGERPFNINATHGDGLLGGVTLQVRK
ncbi:MAG TPA: NEW3 domain-containing protein [Kofleriaceae bacterium]|nr:NEW3 domain-containing protein [Kofleriaceae bacterium]